MNITPTPRGLAMQLVAEMLKAGCDQSEAKKIFNYSLLVAALEQHRGNMGKTAIALGLHRNTLTRQLDEMELSGLPSQIREKHRKQMKLFGTKKPAGSTAVEKLRNAA